MNDLCLKTDLDGPIGTSIPNSGARSAPCDPNMSGRPKKMSRMTPMVVPGLHRGLEARQADRQWRRAGSLPLVAHVHELPQTIWHNLHNIWLIGSRSSSTYFLYLNLVRMSGRPHSFPI